MWEGILRAIVNITFTCSIFVLCLFNVCVPTTTRTQIFSFIRPNAKSKIISFFLLMRLISNNLSKVQYVVALIFFPEIYSNMMKSKWKSRKYAYDAKQPLQFNSKQLN